MAMETDSVAVKKMKSSSSSSKMDVDMVESESKIPASSKGGKKLSRGFELPW